MSNAIASPAHCDTAGPSTTTTVSAKASVAAAIPSLLPIVVLNLSWVRLLNELF
jgi:hypothetical protein